MTAIPNASISDQAQNLSEDGVLLVQQSADWIAGNYLQIGIAAGVGTLIALVLYGLKLFGHRLIKAEGEGLFWRHLIGRVLAKTKTFFIVLASAQIVAESANTPPTLLSAVNLLFTVAAAIQAAIWARALILGFVQHRIGPDQDTSTLASAMGLIRLLVTVALFAIAAVLILDNIGVNVTGLVAGLGIGGIAIGLAAQGIFSDLFAALAILFDRPFKKGDVIGYDSTSGTVEHIGLKSTRVRSVTGEERIIANKALLDKEILNNTVRQYRRYKFAIGATYETPTDKLQAIPQMMREVVEASGAKFVRCGFVGFGASSVDFELEFDNPAQNFDEGYNRRHAVGMAVLERLNREGIAFAYPTQTSYTAAPDGSLVLPYATDASPPARSRPRAV